MVFNLAEKPAELECGVNVNTLLTLILCIFKLIHDAFQLPNGFSYLIVAGELKRDPILLGWRFMCRSRRWLRPCLLIFFVVALQECVLYDYFLWFRAYPSIGASL